MPRYIYECHTHGQFEVVSKMDEVTKQRDCPVCQLPADRVYTAPPVIYHADGFHITDYGKGNDGQAGDKRELLNKQWSKYWGEAPPPPASDVPKNGGEKF